MKSICGIDCTNCELCSTCNGCAATEGQPFGAECLVAQCCKKGKTALSELKEKLIAAFNTLQIRFFAALAACLVEADDSRTGGLSCACGTTVKRKNTGYHHSLTPFGGNLADSRGRAGLWMESP